MLSHLQVTRQSDPDLQAMCHASRDARLDIRWTQITRSGQGPHVSKNDWSSVSTAADGQTQIEVDIKERGRWVLVGIAPLPRGVPEMKSRLILTLLEL